MVVKETVPVLVSEPSGHLLTVSTYPTWCKFVGPNSLRNGVSFSAVMFVHTMRLGP